MIMSDHTSLQTPQITGARLGCSRHPPYSPDLAPSDYHLFQPLQNGKNIDLLEACKKHLEKFLMSKAGSSSRMKS